MRWLRAAGRRRSTMDVALATLATIEDAVDMLPAPRPRTLVACGWEAVAGDADTAALARLPADDRQLGAAPPEPGVRTTVATGATLVRLAKLSTRRQIRGRAFYLDREPALTVKFAVGGPPELARIEREITARTALARTRHLPAPAILHADVAAELSYVVEPVVFGQHAHRPDQKQELALRLVTSVLLACRDLGVTDEPLVAHPETMSRLRRLASAVPGVPAGLLDAAERLLADDATLPSGWCHGDLGFSNVIVDGSGAPTLVDWEHADRMPVAVDLAKLATMAPDQGSVVRHVLATAGPDDIGKRPGRRSVPDQLALLVLRELSWWQRRRSTAEASGRLAPFERGIRRRLRLLDLVLAA